MVFPPASGDTAHATVAEGPFSKAGMALQMIRR